MARKYTSMSQALANPASPQSKRLQKISDLLAELADESFAFESPDDDTITFALVAASDAVYRATDLFD